MKTFLRWFVVGLVILVCIVLVLLAINWVLPPDWKMDSEVLITLAAAVLSLVFMYFPKLRTEFAGLPSETKLYVNVGLVVLLAVFMFLGTCTGWLPIAGIVCTQAGLKTLLVYVFLAGGGNQLTYKVSGVPADVKLAKANRDAAG